jgi:hypothetical protein
MERQNRAEKHYQIAVDNVAQKSASGMSEGKIMAASGETRKFVRYSLLYGVL